MRKKEYERKEARKLRRGGKSVKWIAKELNVSQGSVSVWVRDIILTEDQKENLQKVSRGSQLEATKAASLMYRNKRKEYQNAGRKMARKGDSLHLIGCMLYWAEGGKNKNVLSFNNSDESMISVFVKFLTDCMCVNRDKIKVSINAYTNNGLSIDDIEEYWQHITGIERKNFKKFMENRLPKSSQGIKIGKLPYGCCNVVVNSTEVVQKVFGSIQEYIGVDKPEWLDVVYGRK